MRVFRKVPPWPLRSGWTLTSSSDWTAWLRRPGAPRPTTCASWSPTASKTWKTTTWHRRRWSAYARAKSASIRWTRWSAILAWRIELTATATRQLRKLDRTEAKRITTLLRQRLATLDDPRSAGRALTGPQLGAFRRYRVGDYRIICDIQDGALCILVIEIGNRREVYR